MKIIRPFIQASFVPISIIFSSWFYLHLLFSPYHDRDAGGILDNTFVLLTAIISGVWTIRITINMIRTRHLVSDAFGVIALYASILVVSFATFYKSAGILQTATSDVLHTGFAGLYLSIMTITSVGYGDYVPVTNFGRILAMLEALIGYFLMALIVAVIIEYSKKSTDKE